MIKKANEGWTLCPSKRFPGKYYYFNAVNGEAVWCLTEAEQKPSREDSIKRVVDKTHSYPEPITPPTKEASNPCYNFTSPTNIPSNYHLTTQQMFGRPVFPKYIPHEYVPSYVLPIPQMFVTNRPETKLVSDQLTQTSDAGGNRENVIVHCSRTPLSKRFSTYSQAVPTKTFENKGVCSNNNNWWNKASEKNNFSLPQGSIFGPKIIKHNLFTPNTTSTTFIQTFFDHNKNENKIIKEPVLRGFTGNEIKETNKNHLCNSNTKQTAFVTSNIGWQVENPSIFTNIDNSKDTQKAKTSIQNSAEIMDTWLQQNPTGGAATQKSTITPGNREEIPPDNVVGLDQNDLRLVLKAKRRKLQLGDQKKPEQINETTKQNPDNTTIEHNMKKHVTFDVPSSTEEEMESVGDSVLQDSENSVSETTPRRTLDASYLKSLSEPFHKPDVWYVVVDMGVLLDHFEFIDDFVKRDASCKLLVPNSVRTYVETISVGQYCGRSRVLAARRASRRLASPGPRLVLQPPILELCSHSAIDAIIECCKQISQRHHAILVTSDSELYNKGVSNGIHTFKINDIKANCHEEVTFNIQKVINNNIFMQNTDDFEPLAVNNTDHSPTNEPVFKVPKVLAKTNKKTPVKVDACTSPVIFNKLMNISKTRDLNSKITQDVDSESSIEENIKSLSLKDDIKNTNEELKTGDLKIKKFNFRKVILNPNCSINKEQVTSTEPQKKVKKIILNRNHLKRTVEKSEFKPKPQSVNVTEKPQIKITQVETIKPQTKNVTEGDRLMNSIDEGLKKFQVGSSTIKHRIESRLEEWMCCYRQLMEESLSIILMDNLKSSQKILPAPWSLQEAVICLKEVYSRSDNIRKLTARFCDALNSAVDEYGKLSVSLTAGEFMTLFDYGALLVGALKKLLPHSEDLKLSEDSLQNLLEHIQEPSTDLELPSNHTPLLRDVDDMEELNRKISPKKPAEIIEYLKRYYPAWKDYVEEKPAVDQTKTKSCIQAQERTVIQTFGNRLSNIKINNAKCITFDNDVKITNKFDKNTENLINVDEFNENENKERNSNKKMTNIFSTEGEHSRNMIGTNNINKSYSWNNINKDLNNSPFNDEIRNDPRSDQISIIVDNNKTTRNPGFSEQKSNITITRNVKIIDEYEKRNVDSPKKAFEDANVNNLTIMHNAKKINDYEMKSSNKNKLEKGVSENYFKPNVFIDNDNFMYDAENYNPFLNDFAQINDSLATDDIEHYDNDIVFSDVEAQRDYTQNNNSISLYDGVNDNDAPVNDVVNDGTNDSGFENDGLQACAFIRAFLTELSGSFKVIYSFIDSSIREFRDDIEEDARKELYDKANETHLHVTDIIGKLKVIIEREAAQQTKLKTLIVNAGVDANTDKRMTRYRQVVTKSLEQAQLLESALKRMLALANRHCDIAALDDHHPCDIRYFNIFE